MVLLVGTRNGVYRSADGPAGPFERVLDAGVVPRVRTFSSVDGAFAATKTGLYRSVDAGLNWESLDVPTTEVYSVTASQDGSRLYAGTHPARLYVSETGGSSWQELHGFQDLPSREQWHTPRHRNEAHVRSLRIDPGAPERVIAGVEVGGVHVSDDRGETWVERRDGLHDDVHHVLVVGPDTYVASCGDGLYVTDTAGRTWTRLDGGLAHRYFREAFDFNGVLFAAAARSSPGTWQGESGADAVLVESTDTGTTLTSTPYPGEPEEVVLAWTTVDGSVLAGTNEGSVLRRDRSGQWTAAGTVPASVWSLEAI